MSSSSASPATSPSEWSSAKAAGNAAYTAGRTAEAVESYTRALQCPDLPPAERATLLNNRAQAFLTLGQSAAAVEDCTACLTLAPDNVKALFRRCVRARARVCVCVCVRKRERERERERVCVCVSSSSSQH